MGGLESLFVSPWYWLIGGLVVAGLEMVVAGVFLLWIGLGAMIVGVLLLLMPDLSLTAQLLIFAVTMLASIGLGFVIQKRSGLQSGAVEINRELHALVGMHCEVASDFAAGRGRIRIGDTTYAAQGEGEIRSGEIVEIVSADSAGIRVIRARTAEAPPRA
jgi:inner membrane protein